MTQKVKLDGYENYMQITFEFISFVFKLFIGCVFLHVFVVTDHA